MEVRCEGCNKLFRISDDKITGKGIKFTCTKCGKQVKVTKEDFEQYQLSLSAVSVLDTFVPTPKTPAPAAAQAHEEPKPVPIPSPPEPEAPAVAAEPATDTPSADSAIPDVFREREEPVSFESSPFIDLPQEPASQPEQAAPPAAASPEDTVSTQDLRQAAPEEPEHQPEIQTKTESVPAAEPVREPVPAPEPAVKPETPPPVTEAKTLPEEPSAEIMPEQTPAPAVEVKPAVQPAPAVAPKEAPAAPVQPKPAPESTPKPPAIQPVQPQKRAAPRPPSPLPRTAAAAAPEPKAHTSKLTILIVAAVLLVGLIGIGAYMFLPEKNEPAVHLTSIAGLHIENASAVPEADGDLLISGTVVNEMNTPQDAWLVVVDVFDANGGTIKKLRSFRGQQLYSKNDFDILNKRGANIQDLKAKLLSGQGAVIPAKGSVNFEIRYFQPPVGVASFNAILQPYDPVQLAKEVASIAN